MTARRQDGFTIIELLVVIAILALLLAILVPSLRRAREMAVFAVCRSNLRQAYIGCRAYESANGDWPRFRSHADTGDDWTGHPDQAEYGQNGYIQWLLNDMDYAPYDVTTCPVPFERPAGEGWYTSWHTHYGKNWGDGNNTHLGFLVGGRRRFQYFWLGPRPDDRNLGDPPALRGRYGYVTTKHLWWEIHQPTIRDLVVRTLPVPSEISFNGWPDRLFRGRERFIVFMDTEVHHSDYGDAVRTTGHFNVVTSYGHIGGRHSTGLEAANVVFHDGSAEGFLKED